MDEVKDSSAWRSMPRRSDAYYALRAAQKFKLETLLSSGSCPKRVSGALEIPSSGSYVALGKRVAQGMGSVVDKIRQRKAYRANDRGP